jgi:DTW domain-containing protein YfiP
VKVEEFVPRSVCERCARPTSVCCCSLVPRIPTDVRLVVVQHPRESRMPIGTAAMAVRSVEGAALVVGTDVDESAELRRLLTDPERPAVLLWPGEDARDLEASPPPVPLTLVVVDGTWTTARKLLQRNNVLAALPRVRLTPERPSRYRIRKEPRHDCLSTIEATSLALGAIEKDENKYRPMLAAFERMVDIQIEHQARGSGRREKRPRGAKPPAPLPPAFGHPRDWVCVFAEANAFSYGHPNRPEDELLHVVAVRCGDGAVFDRVARPSGPLAPAALRHAEIAPEQLEGAPSARAVIEELARFLRPSDRWVGWGSYSMELCVRAGARADSWLDLRSLAGRLSPGPVGSLEAASARLGLASAPLGIGRAGRRAGLAAGVVRRVAERWFAVDQ